MKILILIAAFVAVVSALPQTWMSTFPRESIDEMIANFKTLERNYQATGFWSDESYPDNSPFKEIIYRKVPQPNGHEIRLPVYIHDQIKHVVNDRRPSMPNDIIALLKAKDMRIKDEAGHLLAYSLGGGMSYDLNYVPMAICLNRGEYLKTENQISAFLNDNRRGEVDWHLVVIYEELLRNKQRAFQRWDGNLHKYNLRPIGFCLKYYTKTTPNANRVIGGSKCFYNILHTDLEEPKN